MSSSTTDRRAVVAAATVVVAAAAASAEDNVVLFALPFLLLLLLVFLLLFIPLFRLVFPALPKRVVGTSFHMLCCVVVSGSVVVVAGTFVVRVEVEVRVVVVVDHALESALHPFLLCRNATRHLVWRTCSTSFSSGNQVDG